nr:hypothetical protein [Ningiella sp. W23]
MCKHISGQDSFKPQKAPSWRFFIIWDLGSGDLSRLNLQQSVWYLGKAEPMWCGYSP